MPRPIPQIPDRQLYRPRFNPWVDDASTFGCLMARIRPLTLVSEESCYALYTLAQQALHLAGEIWECGVFKGGTATLLAEVTRDTATPVRLFDVFSQMPPIDPRHDLPYPCRDQRPAAELAEVALPVVRQRLAAYPQVSFHPGLIPRSFAGLEDAAISLAHIDVDLYAPVLASCAFTYERLVPGGFLVIDDYGYPSCPGARRAVDEFFRDKRERPLVSPTAQAIVIKLP